MATFSISSLNVDPRSASTREYVEPVDTRFGWLVELSGESGMANITCSAVGSTTGFTIPIAPMAAATRGVIGAPPNNITRVDVSTPHSPEWALCTIAASRDGRSSDSTSTTRKLRIVGMGG
jgi:hypothetical protein